MSESRAGAESVPRVAVLDDYQGVALSLADWSVLDGRVSVTVFGDHLVDADQIAARLQPYDIVVAMRERTPFPAALLARLPRLRLLVTSGNRNAAIDVAAATVQGVVVCGTEIESSSTVELTWALILAAARNLEAEVANMRSGSWATTLGTGLAGKTLGIVGLGRIGSAVAKVGVAFGMEVVAWSEHLTQERAAQEGARWCPLDDLLRHSDVVTIHQVLSRRTRGLIGVVELGLMKPTALLVNTSRGPIIDTEAVLSALRAGTIGGLALDVYDEEPLASDHPLRSMPRAVVTPHIGYVTRELLATFYRDIVDDIVHFLDGEPIRVLGG
ncbi:MAG: D-2-hydroxyacid dehydrogenase family protein [Nocardioidaceae bacterium]